MTALRAATIELGPLVRGLPRSVRYPSPAVSGYFRLGGAIA
ncbi:hypothetical protein MJ524_26335 [Escherichia coli]|nr:hypothetical protein MJ524_26335 [Escherichia coli]